MWLSVKPKAATVTLPGGGPAGSLPAQAPRTRTEASRAMASRRPAPPEPRAPPPSAPRPPPPPDAGRRRRRPSGEPPPLPRDLRRSGRYWAALSAGVVIVWFLVAVT